MKQAKKIGFYIIMALMICMFIAPLFMIGSY